MLYMSKAKGIKNTGPILDEVKGAVDSKKKQFIAALASAGLYTESNRFSSHLEGVKTDKEKEPLVFINLIERNKDIFTKKPQKLSSFRDQRLMDLVTILADDKFWNELYVPMVNNYNAFIEENRSNGASDTLNTSSFLGMANKTEVLKDASAEKSIILRILYFLKGGNPYSSKKLEDTLQIIEYNLNGIDQKLRFEIALLQNRLIEISCFNSLQGFSSKSIEFRLSFRCYLNFIISAIDECQEIFNSLLKISIGKELLSADDLIALWGGSKRSFMNERAKKDTFIAKADYGGYNYSRNDSLKWLKQKKALGVVEFNSDCQNKEIQIDDIARDQTYNSIEEKTSIKVIGVGGSGANIVEEMIANNIEDVDFICADTDSQTLKRVNGATHLQLGDELTRGFGAGANPDVGRKAAESDRGSIEKSLKGADIIFIVAGMGGGTGTGAAPVIASIAKEMGALTFAHVTKPFKFEGKKRIEIAEKGVVVLDNEVDSIMIIEHDSQERETTIGAYFSQVNQKVIQPIKIIRDSLLRPGVLKVDFQDVQDVFKNSGYTRLLQGKNIDSYLATHYAIRNEFMEEENIQKANSALIVIATGNDLKLQDHAAVEKILTEQLPDYANYMYSFYEDESLGDDYLISILFSMGRSKFSDNILRVPASDNILRVPAFMRKQVD